MTKKDDYGAKLRSLSNWDAYLLGESGLPGPRGNIELAQVVADEGDRNLFERYIATCTPDVAPVNSPREFLAFCGVLGLGRLLAVGDHTILKTLRHFASDPRWRLREAVAMALQRFGDTDMDYLIVEMVDWSHGAPLEQRAAAAAVCEPRLLVQTDHARAAFRILDEITTSIKQVEDRKGEDFLALRKGLGYCWSVAVVALPIEGKVRMEKWLVETDKDIAWIMKENLKKDRLKRMDASWVKQWQESKRRI